MTIFRELFIILIFGYAGEILARFLPIGLPAGVLGILLMLAALGSGILRERNLGRAADYLSNHMGFFFLPAAVTILLNFEYIRPAIWQIILICTVCSVITFAVTYSTVRLFRILLRDREG
jgi:holin-like protein